jgi:ATP-dependent exoDNAse (exonuclease V) alpha subunit
LPSTTTTCRVARIDTEDNEFAVDFDGRRLDELALAYATTIHKS